MDHLPSRLEDAADEIVHTLCRVTANLVLDFGEDFGSPDYASAVLWAYKETGDVEDEEALQATAEGFLKSHDPETRA